ncbi:MAG: polysaccharide deacetylase family protein [Bacteroidales bacterium]|nr:polysaccharide deacetylase family protein [Bacteroidales bacterium]
MRSVCFYFQVHQPFRLRTYRFFDMGQHHNYYDDYLNKSIMQRIAQKCYLPANELMLKLIKKHGKSFNVAYSISGLAIEQFEKYAPEVLKSFQKLADSGNVEFLSETYSHSLASLKNKDEFKRQVEKHSQKMEELFGQKPVTFRNTELIYSDQIGDMVAEMGYKTMLTEGAKHILGWKSSNYLYHHVHNHDLKLLLKNFTLSDDIAFRFSNQAWSEWPLTAEKYTKWLKDLDEDQQVVNLFIDYETFGEHQWEDSGIFKFMQALPEKVLKTTDFVFSKPKDIARKFKPVAGVEVNYPISWADEERDLTAWLGNEMQDEAFDKLYSIQQMIMGCDNEEIMKDWNYLQASDHFYYMCTKWFSDGDVHRYFNPYPSPYEAFINYMNVLSDFAIRVEDHCKFTNDNIKDMKKKVKDFTDEVKESAKKTTDKAKARAKEKWDGVKDYTLDDIAKMSNAKVKELINKVDMEELAHVLKDARDEVKDKIIPNMTKKAKTEYEKLEKELKKIKKSDIKAFTEKIETELKNIWKK